MTHGYTRHGTLTLFAALVQMTGKLIAPTEASHTHIEWLQVEGRVRRNRLQNQARTRALAKAGTA